MEQTNNNVQINGCEHVQLEGVAFYDESKYFMFAPDASTMGSAQVQAGRVTRYRKQGVAQQMSDGTFDFVAKPQLRPKSTLIKKLAHGRASETKDGAIQLTLKVFSSENVNISETIKQEADVAVNAIREYQLKR